VLPTGKEKENENDEKALKNRAAAVATGNEECF
jgi:hypothetical protein